MQRLYTPGPVRVPDAILAAGAEPPMHHRSEDFIACSQRVWKYLKSVYNTSQPVAVLAGSGMTGIEAAISSTMRAGEHGIVLVHGRFGARIADIMRTHGIVPHTLEVPWGETITADAVAKALDDTPHATAIWMVHGETSTGVALDVQTIASVVRAQSPNILIGVDAIASLGIHELECDAWDLDLVVSGIQKGLMCPPGLACVSVSQRAQEHIRNTPASVYTQSLATVLKDLKNGLFTWTPPVTLVRSLEVALEFILNEGLPAVWKRHADVSHTLQEGIRDRGLSVFGDGTSHAVTPVILSPSGSQAVPQHSGLQGISSQADKFRSLLFERHAIVVADGQDHLGGTMVRIGTCGSITKRDILELFNAIDDVLPFVHSENTRHFAN